VNAGRKSLFGRDLLKELAELFTFDSGQRVAQGFCVLATDAAYFTKRPVAFFGQMQCILSAIISMWSAFDQPSFLERVEYRHQTTGMGAESRRQILLTDSAGVPQHAQDPGVRRCEIEAGDPLAESHDIWLHFGMAAVSTLLAMDRTTLTAALKPLRRRGLLKVTADPANGRGRLMALTAKGRGLLARAVPIWKNPHAAVEALLPDGDSDRLRNNLRARS
jgi:DNA-binding MarR family transcriptional regulator